MSALVATTPRPSPGVSRRRTEHRACTSREKAILSLLGVSSRPTTTRRLEMPASDGGPRPMIRAVPQARHSSDLRRRASMVIQGEATAIPAGRASKAPARRDRPAPVRRGRPASGPTNHGGSPGTSRFCRRCEGRRPPARASPPSQPPRAFQRPRRDSHGCIEAAGRLPPVGARRASRASPP